MKYTAALLLTTSLVACGGYQHFNVVEQEYQQPKVTASTSAKVVESLLVLGMDVEEASTSRVITKWETLYLNYGTPIEVETQSRVIVDLRGGTITGQCLSRETHKRSWNFRPCTNKSVLHRLRVAATLIQRELGR